MSDPLAKLPSPKTMLTYASILEKPQYWIDPKTSQKYLLATGEIVEAACAALRFCASLGGKPVGWFQPWNDYQGYQQVAESYEGGEDQLPFYACDAPTRS